ncbi:unnamed protein product [Paramecium sonneborni]|uniref:Uncharacterized protein n=1 Tax=Paramecium sonneborni TaxID=65129 RepID=A0A8S1R485_9CILI|nr:unnamed protein product [Paramecium sonneborni]
MDGCLSRKITELKLFQEISWFRNKSINIQILMKSRYFMDDFEQLKFMKQAEFVEYSILSLRGKSKMLLIKCISCWNRICFNQQFIESHVIKQPLQTDYQVLKKDIKKWLKTFQSLHVMRKKNFITVLNQKPTCLNTI